MSINRQVEILNALSQIMHDSTEGQYEEMCCEFDYEAYDGGWSVGSKYFFVRNGASISEILDDPEDAVSELVHELYELMASHTGGHWKKLILSIDPVGRASTRFTY